MSELKTLKNLEYASGVFDKKSRFVCDSKDLRKSAIAWVKAIKEGKFKNKMGLRLRNVEPVLIDWIIHRYNLSEEDVK